MIERVTLNIVSHVDRTEFLREAKQTYKGKANEFRNSARLAGKQLVGLNEYFTSFATLFSMNKNV